MKPLESRVQIGASALQERNKPQVFFLVLSEKETREKIEDSTCDLRC
jgi:hypothetical protein